MNKSDIFWQTYLNLEREVIELSKYIFFADEVIVNDENGIHEWDCGHQLNTFSPYISDLLIRCCVQIEAISKELYFENGGNKSRGDRRIRFDTDCLKLINQKWKTSKKKVLITYSGFNLSENKKILKPLDDAHKSKGIFWEEAYQAVKHDRFYSLPKGNVEAVLNALAALYLLNLYYRNDEWVVSYSDLPTMDCSMGSSIFSVTPPVGSALWINNSPIASESPYVVTYKEGEFKRIKEARKREEQLLNEYYNSQTEIVEDDFKKQLKIVNECSSDTDQNRPPIVELHKYKMNKKIPDILPFAERKEKLLRCNEWNNPLFQVVNELNESEITQDNIQDLIDKVGIYQGILVEREIKKSDWIPIALNSKICRIYIPNDNSIDEFYRE